MLPGQLAQEVAAKAEGVPAADQTHGVLILPVVGKSELRDIGSASESGEPVAEAAVVGQRAENRIGADVFKIKPNAAVIEQEFVGHPGIDDIRVVKRAGNGYAVKRVIDARDIYVSVR